MRRLVPLVFLVLAAACRDGGRLVRPQLVRVSPTGGVAQFASAVALPHSTANTVGGGAWSSAFNIESFRVPLRGVVLADSNTTRGAQLYECSAGTNDGCLVELTGSALTDLLRARSVSVPSGVFHIIRVETCGSEGSYTSYLRGNVVLGGKTWYTKASGVLDTVGPSEPSPIRYQGCARIYSLAEAVDYSTSGTSGTSAGSGSTGPADSVVTFRMYVDLRDIAWASLGGPTDGNAWLPSGCSTSTAFAGAGAAPRPFVCTGYPDIAATIGDALPNVERYRINDYATIGLLFTASSDLPIGGYTRRFFTEGTPYSPSFSADVPVRDLRKNGDGTLYLSTFGGSDGLPTTPGRFQVNAFQRASHSGTFSADGVPGWNYTAVRLP